MGFIKHLQSILEKGICIRVSLPFFTYEIKFEDIFSSKTVDERIDRLDQIRDELEGAISAVDELKNEAVKNKEEAEILRQTVNQLEQDKDVAETVLQVPRDSFGRLIKDANDKARLRGLIEGAIIGFITGGLSSFLVWYLTS